MNFGLFLTLLVAAPAASFVVVPALPLRIRGHVSSATMMADGQEDFTKGISPVLGGGKLSSEVETDTVAENASKAAFAFVL